MRLRLSSLVCLVTFSAVAVTSTTHVSAQDDAVYKRPSAALAALVDAPLTPTVSLSPDRRQLLLLERPALPSIAELAQPELRLAGLRIDPATNGPSRDPYYTGLLIKPLGSGQAVRITGIPEGARLGNVLWSRDGKRLAFTNTTDTGVELWLADVATPDSASSATGANTASATGAAAPSARRLATRLNTVLETPSWLDSETLTVVLIPENRGNAPVAPTVPTGPTVQENLSGQARPARTYADMLASATDEALFEFYATGTPALIRIDGTTTKLGEPAIFSSVAPSPDGTLLLTHVLHRPFSYLVQADRFPTTISVRDRSGKVVYPVAELPLAEAVPIPVGSVRTGPRAVSWRADAPATLSWLNALDGGDAGKTAEWRDEWFVQPSPFEKAPVSLGRFGFRVTSVVWGDGEHALVSEGWRKSRRVRTWLVAPDKAGTQPAKLFDRSSEDRYAHPGDVVTTPNAFGRRGLMLDASGNKIYLAGDGASPEGDRPFLDEFDLTTKTARRLWRSEAPWYESFVAFAGDSSGRVLTQRESATVPPNYVLRTLVSDAAKADAAKTDATKPNETLEAVTDFPNPFPEYTQVKKEVITYKRADGVALSGTLYLPPGVTKPEQPLPTLLWAYPREFKDAAAASQVKESPYRFIRVNPLGPLPFLLAGYAVLDDPTMPIVGAGETEPNDTYVPQLVSSAQAAVDELVRRGVSDPKRMAVAGHSYGAFMTANLLTHSRIFRAGIARSGAYNRTLTPFGFQSEERTLWQAPEVYATMAPFNHADQVKDPLLLIHGAADNNPGTFPIQSERYYNALKGMGATVRYVQLPFESHGYRAKENVLQTLYETETWLNTWLKPAVSTAATK